MPSTKRRRKKNEPPGIDQRLVKAIGHPLRFRLLLAYNERTASPNELSKALEEPIGNVAYHTKILLACEAIELVDTAQRRGATEHYYRAIMRPYFTDEDYAQLPVNTRRSLFAPTIKTILQDISAAAAGSGFDDPAAHASWTTLDLDEEGYQEVVDLLAHTLERALAIHAESAGRWLDTGNHGPPPVGTQLTITHFHRQAPKPAAATTARRPSRAGRKNR